MDDLADVIDELVPDPPTEATELWIDGLSLDLPLELYVRRSAQGERIEASLPTQTNLPSRTASARAQGWFASRV